jgi:hypothetical protein
VAIGMLLVATSAAPAANPPFRNPDLPAAQRIDDLLSRMTIDEKINALGTDSGVARLGVPGFGASEGIHGVVQRSGGKRALPPIPATQFPQPPGMGASWDPELARKAGWVEGYEARYISRISVSVQTRNGRDRSAKSSSSSSMSVVSLRQLRHPRMRLAHHAGSGRGSAEASRAVIADDLRSRLRIRVS